MDIYKQFETDEDLEQEGVWHDIGEDASIKIARSGNENFQKRMRLKIKGRERQIKLNSLPESVMTEILVDCLAQCVLVDWKGFTAQGKKLAYTKENAVKVLTELKDFRDLVVSLSEDVEAFRKQQDEETEKNSSGSSDSNSTSDKNGSNS